MSQTDFDKELKSLLSKSVPLVNVEEFEQKRNHTNLIVLDTRTPDEYEVSHIRGSRFVDYDNFSPDVMAGVSKDEPVVVYCSVGYRSEKIGEKLQALGYENVQNLYGGIFSWKNLGHEVVNKSGVTDSVHTYNKSWSKWLKKGIKVY